MGDDAGLLIVPKLSARKMNDCDGAYLAVTADYDGPFFRATMGATGGEHYIASGEVVRAIRWPPQYLQDNIGKRLIAMQIVAEFVTYKSMNCFDKPWIPDELIGIRALAQSREGAPVRISDRGGVAKYHTAEYKRDKD